MTFPTGHKIGNYRIIQLIGSGGVGDVYEAQHLGLLQRRALKVLKMPLNPKEVTAFEHEAQALAKLQHPNILTVHDFIVEQGTPIIITEFAPGGSLRDAFDRKPGAKPLSDALVWVEQIAAALQYAHKKKIVHRDVKPDNVLIDALGTHRLADFGLAVVNHATASRTSVQIAAGTPLYAPPEQSRHKAVAASDQYALACMVWEWLCGDPPFTGDPMALLYFHLHEAPDPSQLAGVSDATKQVLLQALAKDPSQRFPNIEAFAKALAQSAGGVVATPGKPSAVAPPKPPADITCPRCGQDNPGNRQICRSCGSSLPRPAAPTQILPTKTTAAITPTEAISKGDSFDKAVRAINANVTKYSGRDQHSFDYTWIRKQCGIHGSLSREFLQQLVDYYKAAGWHAWLYENQHDMSGVAEDPAFVLDAPGRRTY
ncbi:MAG TPA: protein kinase [Candidatus Acidoferrum sp.]|nr:protein kinase [Candidatus Acidoferrum sp.]